MANIAPSRVVEATDDDAELTAASAAGDGRAFDELYRRHEDAALRVARSTVRNPDDARDAVAEAFTRVFRALPEARSFRPYLLATVRNCAVDIVRRAERRERAEAGGGPREADEACQPVDRVVAGEDERIVVQAFAQLPQRWQQALWLIDVEELSTREAGSALGVSASNAAQLASRARLRLREEYLQAHVPNHIRPRCGVTVAALGSFVAGTASPRIRLKVDTHLISCGDCRARVAELRDVAGVLRRAVLPLPLLWAGAGARGRSRGRLSAWLDRLVGSASGSPTGRSVVALLPEASAASPVFERLMAGTTAAVLAAGISVLAVTGHDGGSDSTQPGNSAGASSEGVVGAGPGVSAGTGPGGVLGGPLGAGLVGPGPGAGSVGAGSVGSGGIGAGSVGVVGPGGALTDAVAGLTNEPTVLDRVMSATTPAGLDLSGANLGGVRLPGLDLFGSTGGVAPGLASLAAVLGVPVPGGGPSPLLLPGLAALASGPAPSLPSLSEGLLSSPGSPLPAPVLPSLLPPTGAAPPPGPAFGIPSEGGLVADPIVPLPGGWASPGSAVPGSAVPVPTGEPLLASLPVPGPTAGATASPAPVLPALPVAAPPPAIPGPVANQGAPIPAGDAPAPAGPLLGPVPTILSATGQSALGPVLGAR